MSKIKTKFTAKNFWHKPLLQQKEELDLFIGQQKTVKYPNCEDKETKVAVQLTFLFEDSC
jgi:hypothetical protein